MKTSTASLLVLLASACSAAPDDSRAGPNGEEEVIGTDEAPLPAADAATCTAPTLTRWPFDGVNGRAWFNDNFVDLDSGIGAAATKDFKGKTGANARTYDGHKGIDIAIPNFRGMDHDTAVVHAATDGVVEDFDDSNDDRNIGVGAGCSLKGNFVKVRHAGGHLMKYWHLKKSSVVVAKNDVVHTGDVLGIAGSSGCSSRPHLHFEVVDCSGKVVDSMGQGLWSSPPAYEPPSGVMDVVLKRGTDLTFEQIIDPGNDVTNYVAREKIVIGLSLSAKNDDTVEWRLIRPNGTQASHFQKTIADDRMHTRTAVKGFTLGTDDGTWKVEIWLNGSKQATRTFHVAGPPPPPPCPPAQKCCEPDGHGGCDLCVDRDLTCP
jgi:murein DD-endopeptidase MepM/ murein hydrolase activator NlpD